MVWCIDKWSFLSLSSLVSNFQIFKIFRLKFVSAFFGCCGFEGPIQLNYKNLLNHLKFYINTKCLMVVTEWKHCKVASFFVKLLLDRISFNIIFIIIPMKLLVRRTKNKILKDFTRIKKQAKILHFANRNKRKKLNWVQICYCCCALMCSSA